MRIVVAGSSGMIGQPLVRWWRAAGHEVVRLVRRPPSAPGEVSWDPASGRLDPSALGKVDAAVNFAGVGVGDHRWTSSYRRVITESRTRSTAVLSRALADLDTLPSVLLQASATGYYGDRGESLLDEDDPAGTEFLARVCVAWEAAAAPARSAGIRTVLLRTGLVLGPGGGLVGSLMPLVRAGVAGPIGSGRAWWSWISLEGHLRAVDHLLTAEVAGAVNLVAPRPARSGEVIAALAGAVNRPAAVPVPAFALKAALGGFAEEILASRRVTPRVLERSAFTFSHPDIEAAVSWLLTAA